MADPDKLKNEEREQLTKLLEKGEKYSKFYKLAQNFRVMLKEGRINEWGGWLAEAKASGIEELLSFATGLERDEKAVKNAIRGFRVSGEKNNAKAIYRIEKP